MINFDSITGYFCTAKKASVGMNSRCDYPLQILFVYFLTTGKVLDKKNDVMVDSKLAIIGILYLSSSSFVLSFALAIAIFVLVVSHKRKAKESESATITDQDERIYDLRNCKINPCFQHLHLFYSQSLLQ